MRQFQKFEEVVGKKITGVIVKESADRTPPFHQVFFEFEDGTYFELYSDSRMLPAHVGKGGRREMRSYMAPRKRVVFEVPGEENDG